MNKEHSPLYDLRKSGEYWLTIGSSVVVKVLGVVRADQLQLGLIKVDDTGFDADVILEERVTEGGENCLKEVQLPDASRNILKSWTFETNNRLQVILDSVFCLLALEWASDRFLREK